MGGQEPRGLLFGIHAVEAALRSHPERVTRLMIDRHRNDARVRELLELAQGRDIAIERWTRQELHARAGSVPHQGVMADVQEAAQAPPTDLEALLDAAEAPPLLLVLDGVQDPHNLGACLRSAEAAGALAIVAPKDRAVGLTPAARKVASGSAERLPFVQVTNLARSLRELQERGVWLYGAAGDAEETIYDVDLTGPTALVLGAEGGGLRRLTREHCDRLVRIPMRGAVESLNVSVAAGVCLFEAARQRGAG